MARLTLPNGKGHGWKPDTYSDDDYPLSRIIHPKAIAAIQSDRPQIWLDPELISKTRDQGEQGSCTGHGTVDALEWSYRFNRKVDPKPFSVADAYLGGRMKEASVPEDSGCEIRDVIWAAAKDGVCLEKYIPYNDKKLAIKRTKTSIRNATFHQVDVGYYRCDDNETNRDLTIDNMIRALANNMPIVGGYAWLTCLDRSPLATSGIFPYPSGGAVGGHCNSFLGVDIPARMWLAHNSWGDYGAKHPVTKQSGFFLIPFSWVLKGAMDDCWAIRHE
jgi:hypothetical protein